ncbi:TetR/AcrR family transcriptional regulator [Nonomuraea sp. NPDC059194]|uniref:TetR/AcrR family transcriptional regulator n=1 Tax=Nonomuraea sp. NPDC059194 TaxID=3346764 RepID=UPI0036AC7FF9
MPDLTRADARRNREHLLDVAGEVFAEQGTDASLREVARRAGVGIGTLYRHFPTREALLEALTRASFESMRERADELLTSPSPRQALLEWLRVFAVRSTTYRGLPESVMAALRQEGSELHASCEGMRTAGGRLLTRAQEAGEVRPEVTGAELLALVAGIAWAVEQSPGRDDLMDRLLTLAANGFLP